jgi:hypothetical protein
MERDNRRGIQITWYKGKKELGSFLNEEDNHPDRWVGPDQ